MDFLEFLRDGSGYGPGSGHGSGDGSGYGHGSGHGSGYGSASGHGSGYGYGSGSGHGSGYGSGSGHGSGSGSGEINGIKVYNIDGVPTAVEAVHGNCAKGYIIRNNTNLVPCYIARIGSSFAHGATLKEAFDAAQAKEWICMPEDERARLFIEEHPSQEEVITNKELFAIHNMLTGSCELGRREFCKTHDIDLDGSMTIQCFLELTRNEYGKQIIEKIIEKYQN